MGQLNSVLPVQCRDCGAVFDLWPKIVAREDKGRVRRSLGKELEKSEFLCERCSAIRLLKGRNLLVSA